MIVMLIFLSFTSLVIDEFKILQESCKQSWKGMHTTCKQLARFLQDLNNLARVLQDFEFNLQVSCKIMNSSCKFLARF